MTATFGVRGMKLFSDHLHRPLVYQYQQSKWRVQDCSDKSQQIIDAIQQCRPQSIRQTDRSTTACHYGSVSSKGKCMWSLFAVLE